MRHKFRHEHVRRHLVLAQAAPSLLNNCAALCATHGIDDQPGYSLGLIVNHASKADDNRPFTCFDKLAQFRRGHPSVVVKKKETGHTMVVRPIGRRSKNLLAHRVQRQLGRSAIDTQRVIERSQALPAPALIYDRGAHIPHDSAAKSAKLRHMNRDVR
jgi:hypothetical protein